MEADKTVERKDLTAEMLLLEYFHDDDVDYVSVQNDDETTKTEIADIPQGIVHQKTLLLFYAKKFSRCPERYFVNSFFLGVYMMVANVMLINLLVALFATTYETVQEDSDKIWKLNRFDLVMDYWGKDPIPTPLILVFHVMLLIKYILFSCGEKKNRRTNIVCWPRIPGDHAVNLKQFPLELYPPTGKDTKKAENSTTIDSLIKNLVDFEKVEVQSAKEKGAENDEPAEVMQQMNEKLERLRESVLQLQTRLRNKNKNE
ncbi:unnamed protein product [Oikopleura dioica]|uniref:Ion transport domain-containing protein n=1 Tax=Oikopleura dioica TaxID=34765 RepID=E4X3R1_OIKDI|nr:unnamed protein product [Oikopleura dioica]